MNFIKIETIETATKMSETTSKNTQNGWTNLKEIETYRNCGSSQRAFTVQFLSKVELMLGKHICLTGQDVILSFTFSKIASLSEFQALGLICVNNWPKP